MTRYRVWPDGTVQDVEDGPAYTFMSDDFMLVEAETAEEAENIMLGWPANYYPPKEGV